MLFCTIVYCFQQVESWEGLINRQFKVRGKFSLHGRNIPGIKTIHWKVRSTHCQLAFIQKCKAGNVKLTNCSNVVLARLWLLKDAEQLEDVVFVSIQASSSFFPFSLFFIPPNLTIHTTLCAYSASAFCCFLCLDTSHLLIAGSSSCHFKLPA